MRTHPFRQAMLIAALALAPAGAAVAGRGELLTGVPSDSVDTSVSRDGEVFLGPFSTVNARCKKTSDARAWIVEAPRYGRAFVGRQRGEIAYGEGQRLAYCNDRPLVGTTVRYRPARGFVGDDTFVYVLKFSDGEVRAKRVNVHVE
jgi:hypothetical protein